MAAQAPRARVSQLVYAFTVSPTAHADNAWITALIMQGTRADRAASAADPNGHGNKVRGRASGRALLL